MKNLIMMLALVAACACTEKPDGGAVSRLADATDLKVEQTDLKTVKLTWTDNAQGEKGYRIYLRGEKDPADVKPITTAEADVTEYIFTELSEGKSYDFGVQAISEDYNLHSSIVYIEDYVVLNKEELSNLEGIYKVAAPSDVEAQQQKTSLVVLTWTDNASDETGYDIYVRDASATSFGKVTATVDADVESYEFTNLVPGRAYVFGVQAKGAHWMNDSKVIEGNGLTIIDFEESQRKTPVVTEVKTSYAYIAVTYKVEKLTGSNPEHGVCFSEAGAPSMNDIKVLGPQISANAEILQVVPNAYLEDGKEYQMSVFVKNGDEYYYSEPQTVKLEAQPEIPQLTWEKQDYAGAEGVEIYKTTSQLNGRNFNAWYAVADPSMVDFKVLNTPTGKANLKTVAYQAENADSECLVLINGGVFGNYHIGVIHTDGTQQEWVDFVYDKYWNPNDDGTSWYITRPIVGVDKNGKAGVYWTASPSFGTYYYYDRPLPTVPGEAGYAAASSTFPVPAIDWKPYNALSTGPMVLYDGKCCVDHTKAPSGAYMTNYECWKLDIYEGRPDRTAVGVTSDGKIILFICDGRIEASQGATHEEVAMIMKSIGCVHAMNLDGGGSTGMWVNGVGMINYKDGSWRAVKSTLGFFKKK